jgi:23S rRNA (cytidine1920-2'-O)/16S rRNA (cytidine1409-2'-O)-methyltransferase
VVSLDRRNIRTLPEGDIAEKADIATVDTSFISLKKVLPRVRELLGQGGEILALVKPQFEVGKGEVGKKGIVREQSKHRQVLEDLCSYAEKMDLTVLGTIESPLLGTKGNKEFFLYLRKQGP